MKANQSKHESTRKKCLNFSLNCNQMGKTKKQRIVNFNKLKRDIQQSFTIVKETNIIKDKPNQPSFPLLLLQLLTSQPQRNNQQTINFKDIKTSTNELDNLLLQNTTNNNAIRFNNDVSNSIRTNHDSTTSTSIHHYLQLATRSQSCDHC
ncbi:hypothetical protein ABK040_006751 [Willaertia magna]